MRTLASITSLGLLAAALLSCQGQDNLTDKEKLQGTWRMITGERGGEPMEAPESYSFIIEGDKFQFMQGPGGFRGLIKLDHGRDPKVMDLELRAEGKPNEPGPTSKGIYLLDGDSLKWCNAAPGVEERPSTFSTTKENNHMLATFQRVEE